MSNCTRQCPSTAGSSPSLDSYTFIYVWLPSSKVLLYNSICHRTIASLLSILHFSFPGLSFGCSDGTWCIHVICTFLLAIKISAIIFQCHTNSNKTNNLSNYCLLLASSEVHQHELSNQWSFRMHSRISSNHNYIIIKLHSLCLLTNYVNLY